MSAVAEQFTMTAGEIVNYIRRRVCEESTAPDGVCFPGEIDTILDEADILVGNDPDTEDCPR